MPQDTLTRAFLTYLPPDTLFAPAEMLEDSLRSLLEAGRARWPGVAVAPNDFLEHVARRMAAAQLPTLERAPDLYLACGCAHGVPGAVEAFYGTFRGDIARAVRRIDRSPAFHDDVMQAIGELLFLSTPDRPARIVEYAGRSSLRGWIASVARRTALNLRRRKGDRSYDSLTSFVSALDSSATGGGPESKLLKAGYKVELEAAIRLAMATLSARDRSLLVMQLAEGLTLPEIARKKDVSRATVARWLAFARRELREQTRRELITRLRLAPSELEGVAALVRSQFELSLADVVGYPAERTPRGPQARKSETLDPLAVSTRRGSLDAERNPHPRGNGTKGR